MAGNHGGGGMLKKPDRPAVSEGDNVKYLVTGRGAHHTRFGRVKKVRYVIKDCLWRACLTMNDTRRDIWVNGENIERMENVSL